MFCELEIPCRVYDISYGIIVSQDKEKDSKGNYLSLVTDVIDHV